MTSKKCALTYQTDTKLHTDLPEGMTEAEYIEAHLLPNSFVTLNHIETKV